jgi:hypothetical protein
MINLLSLKGQSFYIDNGSIAWQKIYDTEMTSNQIIKSIFMSCEFTDITVVDSSFIVATISPQNIDYEKQGYKRMQLPIYISNNYLGPAKVIIQVQPGRYLVTVKKITLTGKDNNPLNGGILNDVAVSNGEFSSTFTQYGAPIYDHFLSELFTLEMVEEDW